LHVRRLLRHKSIQNTLIYIDLGSKLFNSSGDGFTWRIASNTGEASSLIEAGFEYVTEEYNDGGKLSQEGSNTVLVWFSEKHGKSRHVYTVHTEFLFEAISLNLTSRR
jgi:hypothetical protein